MPSIAAETCATSCALAGMKSADPCNPKIDHVPVLRGRSVIGSRAFVVLVAPEKSVPMHGSGGGTKAATYDWRIVVEGDYLQTIRKSAVVQRPP
jgi:hypothetical protein